MNDAGRHPIAQSASNSLLPVTDKAEVILCLLMVLITIALYNPISRAPFLNFDDDYYIIQNSHVRAGLTWATVTWAFQSTEMSNWHPLTWVSHTLDVQWFGLNPAGHHYINVLFHALNTVLLFLFLKRTTGKIGSSAVVATLFAIHPINVESVAWISERKNVLSMLFFLSGLLAYVWYVRKISWHRYLLVAASFAAGLMAKPQVITFPFVLLLLDYWPLRRMAASAAADQSAPNPKVRSAGQSLSRLLVEKLPLFVLSAASAIVTMHVQAAAFHLQLPLSVRVENAACAYLQYLAKLVWPTNLALLYPHPGNSVSGPFALLGMVVVLGVTVLVLLAGQRRYLVVGWFWFIGTLVPMIGLVQVGVQSMADRYAYIPCIGVFVATCYGVADLLQRWRAPRAAGVLAGGIALFGVALATNHQIAYWKDNLTLWSHTLEVTRDNFIAEDSMGMALAILGRSDEAVIHFQNAIRINPGDPIGNLNLGNYEMEQHNYAVATDRYQRVVQLTANRRLLTAAFSRMGTAYYYTRQYDLAEQSFQSALYAFPENSQAFLGLGLLAQRRSDFSQAAEYYRRALQFQPSAVGYLLLARALESTGHSGDAAKFRAEAERISPDFIRARQETDQLLSF